MKTRSATYIFLLVSSVVMIVFGWNLMYSPHLTVSSDAVPSDLMSGFKSMQSFSSVETSLAAHGLSWKIVEDSGLSPGDKRPQFDVKTIDIEGFRHLNSVGILRLEFFNDRLMRTTFYPKNMPSYKAALEEELGRPIGGQPTDLGGSTSLFKGEDAYGREYINWADKRLQEEQAEWIKRYSLWLRPDELPVFYLSFHEVFISTETYLCADIEQSVSVQITSSDQLWG